MKFSKTTVDIKYLPHILSLTVLILAFRPLVRRVGEHANIWFLGFSFLCFHYVALMFIHSSGWVHLLARLLQIWSLDSTGLAFLFVCANVPTRSISRVLTALLALPILLQSALYVCGNRHPSMHYAACALFFLPAMHMMVTPGRERKRPLILVKLTFAAFGAVMTPIAWTHQHLVADGSLTLLFLCSAYLYVISVPRITRGVVVAVAGLVAWTARYPITALLATYHPDIVIDPELLRFPQYMTAAGVLLTLMEEHIFRTERMAMHDPLTDLPNRRLFEERLIATMEDARIHKTTVACLVIDVDNFKAINDTLGHNAGDQLLRALSVRLSWHMSPRDILARTGGDEFTALLAGVNDEHHLRFIAGAMMSAASVPIIIDGEPVDVRISVGIALSPDDADDIDSLRRAADEAMYSAKRRGGSLLAFASDR